MDNFTYAGMSYEAASREAEALCRRVAEGKIGAVHIVDRLIALRGIINGHMGIARAGAVRFGGAGRAG